ncbi:hypothetical protein [Ensifer aridi]|nr:hypothetical protein [Ensifer aridi]
MTFDYNVMIYISSVGLAIVPIAGDPNKFDGTALVVFIVQGRIAA